MAGPTGPSGHSLTLLVLGFSLTAGFIDLVTLVRFSQFAAMQTGNMIMIGRDLYRLTLPNMSRDELLTSIAFHVATLVSHFAGVVLFCALAHWTRYPVRWAALLVGVLTASGALLDILSKGNDWGVCLVAASMGAMNFIPSPNSGLSSKLFMMTAIATGNLQKCAKMFFKLISCQKFSDADREQTCRAATTVIATIVGAILGALALFAKPLDTTYGQSIYLLLMAPLQSLVLFFHDFIFRPRPEAREELTADLGASLADMNPPRATA
ncbi:unnamed protein product [Effrenium voratum]|uniref:DUF1275 domain-containing protein n=1 Tax=Effrenium voratum TaxID=2562239 RepID=A0AA36MNN5_9DINO|nr:unnamed protein product [Effrenium voratum]